MRREIAIKEIIHDRYLISESDLIKSIRESVQGNLYQFETHGNLEKVTVVCDPNFMHELLSYFHWKERNAQNYLEDTFRISGQIFYADDRLVIVPRFLLRMVSEDRTKTSVVTNVTNKQGAEYQNYILEQSLLATDYSWLSKFGPLQVIGHGHSHPDLGGIGVKPSSIDVDDHRKNLEDHAIWLSHIVDPIRGLSGFYYGPELKCPKVIYMLYSEDRELFEKSRQVLNRVGPEIIPIHDHKVIPCTGMKDTSQKSDEEEGRKAAVEKTDKEMFETVEYDAVSGKENIEKQPCDSYVEKDNPFVDEDNKTEVKRVIKRLSAALGRCIEFVKRILIPKENKTK